MYKYVVIFQDENGYIESILGANDFSQAVKNACFVQTYGKVSDRAFKRAFNKDGSYTFKSGATITIMEVPPPLV